MQIVEIVVKSGRTVGNPKEQHSNLRSDVVLKAVAGVDEKAWTAEAGVEATQALQRLADQLVREDLERRLRRVELEIKLAVAKGNVRFHKLEAENYRRWAAEQRKVSKTCAKANVQGHLDQEAANLETAEQHDRDAAAAVEQVRGLERQIAALDAGEALPVVIGADEDGEVES